MRNADASDSVPRTPFGTSPTSNKWLIAADELSIDVLNIDHIPLETNDDQFKLWDLFEFQDAMS